MKKKLTVLMLAVIVSLGFLVAQERTITGTVTAAADGSGIPGVNVILKGTTKGAITDTKGQYSLTVPAKGGTLVFSFVGYKSQEVVLGIQNTVNITMQEDSQALSEIVVTGYKSQAKKDITGSVAGISSKPSKRAHGENKSIMGAGAYAQPLMSGGYYAEEKTEQ
jgi:CarboxypepD_reg-like domain